MRASGRYGPGLQPKFGMNCDIRKLACHLLQVCVKPLVSVFVLPRRIDLLDCVTEDGAEPVFDMNGVTEFAFDSIDACLRDVGPQHVGKIRDFDRAHLAFPEEDERISSVCAAGG